ncbi:MAG: enoyl-CoA hydratase/isomerase family protein [Gammaproteobacteria bacterium]|nr:enoyl-CoA hydratase/isomerase family protein [Gammaproteobacteria bacterium]
MTHLPSFATLQLRVEQGIAILSLDRPGARNAIDDAMREDLRQAVDHVSGDAAIRGLLLTGAGSVFCSGGDIRGMQERLSQGSRAGELGWRRQREFHETLGRLFHLDRPTVAAVNGPAYGLGLDLALTCDLVFMSTTATTAASFVKRGLVPDGGGMFHLPRRVGLSRAKELIFSGRNVEPDEALAIGLADRVLPAEELLPAALSWLRSCANHSALAQGLAKGILNRSHELGFEQVNMLGSQAQACCYASPAHQESIRDFLAERERVKRGGK